MEIIFSCKWLPAKVVVDCPCLQWGNPGLSGARVQWPTLHSPADQISTGDPEQWSLMTLLTIISKSNYIDLQNLQNTELKDDIFKFETETKFSSETSSWLELWVFIFFHKNIIFQSPWSRESVCWSLTGWHEHVSGLLGVQRTRMGSWQDILRVQPIINIILTSGSFTHQSLDTLWHSRTQLAEKILASQADCGAGPNFSMSWVVKSWRLLNQAPADA